MISMRCRDLLTLCERLLLFEGKIGVNVFAYVTPQPLRLLTRGGGDEQDMTMLCYVSHERTRGATRVATREAAKYERKCPEEDFTLISRFNSNC